LTPAAATPNSKFGLAGVGGIGGASGNGPGERLGVRVARRRAHRAEGCPAPRGPPQRTGHATGGLCSFGGSSRVGRRLS
jgi:hypothetical protein